MKTLTHMRNQAVSWEIPLLFTWLVLCDTFSQVLFKYASLEIGEARLDHWPQYLAFLQSMAHQPAMAAGLILLLGAFVCWMRLISRIDLSRAHLVSCVVYATVPAISVLVFDDVIGPQQMTGILLISVGAWVSGAS